MMGAVGRQKTVTMPKGLPVAWGDLNGAMERIAADSQFQSYQALSDRRKDLTTVAKRSGWS
jgi:hypothetical protein